MFDILIDMFLEMGWNMVDFRCFIWRWDGKWWNHQSDCGEHVADALPWLRALQARLIKGRNVAFIEYADELQAGLKAQDVWSSC